MVSAKDLKSLINFIYFLVNMMAPYRSVMILTILMVAAVTAMPDSKTIDVEAQLARLEGIVEENRKTLTNFMAAVC